MPNRNIEQKKPTPDKPREAEKKGAKAEERSGEQKKWDVIDENAWESFPASDPPGSWAGRDISPDEREQSTTKKR